MPDFDIVCVGDAKIDTFLTLHDANDHLRLDQETNELCIKFGDKITVERAETLLGGDAANVAVGTSRLGLKSAIVAEIGNDEFAQKVINDLQRENVDTTNVLKDERQQCSFSTIINYKRERTIFSEHVKRPHNFNFENLGSKWVYLTSLGEEWQNAYAKTLDFVKEKGCRLALNPGTLQIESGKDNLKDILLTTDILLVNKEEAEDLLGLPENTQDIEALIKNVQLLGPKTVVITDGENGSFAINGNGEMLKKDALHVETVEKTGAGDAYSSGFLSAIINNQSLADAMAWGIKNSASVVEKVGSQTGLLRKGEIVNF